MRDDRFMRVKASGGRVIEEIDVSDEFDDFSYDSGVDQDKVKEYSQLWKGTKLECNKAARRDAHTYMDNVLEGLPNEKEVVKSKPWGMQSTTGKSWGFFHKEENKNGR